MSVEGHWREGNRVRLLENGEGFYARAFEAIAAARSEILLETFILFEDEVGHALHARLVAAARRGVRVSVLVDGYGSPGFSGTSSPRWPRPGWSCAATTRERIPWASA
ncbi:hypothetical protein [Pseudoxanthomonas suwonensis]